jgi:hypothetical protein
MPDKQENDKDGVGSTDLKRRLVICLLGEAVEKIYRVRHILTRQQVYVEVEHKRFEYSEPIKTLSGAIDRIEAEGLTGDSELFKSLLGRKSSGDSEVNALLGQVQKVLRSIQGIHELLLLLPRESVSPQVFFLLQDCFAVSPKAAIVLTNLICSYEFRVEDVLQKLDLSQRELPYFRDVLSDFTPGGSVVGLAFMDRDNPLAWPVLAHEYGHTLDDAQHISSQIVHGDQVPKEEDEAARVTVSWTAELFCDFVAAHVLGPVSLIPILLVEMTQLEINKEWTHHPPTPIRIALVRKYLAKIGVGDKDFAGFFELYHFDYTQKLEKLESSSRKKEAATSSLAAEMLSSVSESIATKVNSLSLHAFTNARLETARRLQERLKNGSPISAVRGCSDPDLYEKLDLLKEGAPIEDVYAVLTSLDEVPVQSAEILTAGWLYKLGTYQEELQRSFGQSESSLKIYREYLARIDSLLLKSLELSAVQNVLKAPTKEG